MEGHRSELPSGERLQLLEEQIRASNEEVAGMESRLEGKIDQKLDAHADKIEAMMQRMAANMLKNQLPQRGETDSREFIPPDADLEEDADGRLVPADVDLADPAVQKKIEAEAFGMEWVRIVLQELPEGVIPTDAHDSRFVPIQVNGRTHLFVRGMPKKVRRYVVEALARMVKRVLKEKQVDDPDKENQMIHYYTYTPRYPFTVLEDSAIGKAWLQAVIAQERG